MKTVIRSSYTPKLEDYCNTLVIDRETDNKYLFDVDGVWTLLSTDEGGIIEEAVAQANAYTDDVAEDKVDKEEGKGLSENDFTDADKNKLDGIEAGAQENVIEVVKRNGAALPIVGKAVDVDVPTVTSALTNDSGFLSADTKCTSGSAFQITGIEGAPLTLTELTGNATQNGTPTPDAPVAVDTTTGEQTVKIYPDQKNLADPQTFIAWANRTYNLCVQYGWGSDSIRPAVIEYNGRPNVLRFVASTLYDVRGQMTSPTYDEARVIMTGNFKPATQYTISFDVPAGNKRNLQLFFSDNSAVLLTCQNTTDDWAHFSQTSTAGKTLVGLRLTYNEGTTYIDLDTLQIEEGTQATTYEPYQGQEYTIDLGSIELAKIGTYRDHIYKNDGKWYLHKAVRHLSLPIADMNNSESYPGWNNNTTAVIRTDLGTNLNAQLQTITSYSSNISLESQAGWSINTNDSNKQLWTRSNILWGNKTQTQIMTDYPNLVAEIYYGILETNQYDEEITDSTLLAQLNFIANLYGGTNNIMLVGTGAQGEITVCYSDVAKVAITGSYNDLTDKPTVPTVKGQSIYYATCPTPTSTQIKVATTVSGDFTLTAGNMVRVSFTNGNTHDTVTKLNVDGTGAVDIYKTEGSNVTQYFWAPGQCVDFTYDGTKFIMLNMSPAGTSYYGVTKLEDSITSNSIVTAATANSVKTVADMIPTKTSALTNDSGFLTSSTAVTSVNGSTGDITGLQTTGNLVTSVSSSSTDTQYPSAKLFYDTIGNVEAILQTLNNGGGAQ